MYISVNLQDKDNVKKMRDKRKVAKDMAAAAKKKADEDKKKAEKKGLPAPPPAPALDDKVKNEYPEPLTDANIDNAKFQFHFLPNSWAKHTRSLFDPNYHGRIEPTEKAEDGTYDVMKFTSFLRAFDTHIHKDSDPKSRDAQGNYIKGYQGRLPARCMDWLIKKLVFQEGEVVFTEDPKEKAERAEPVAIERYVVVFGMEFMS